MTKEIIITALLLSAFAYIAVADTSSPATASSSSQGSCADTGDCPTAPKMGRKGVPPFLSAMVSEACIKNPAMCTQPSGQSTTAIMAQPISGITPPPPPCGATGGKCVETYSKEATQNYQTGISGVNLINPVTGGVDCVVASGQCKSDIDHWNTTVVQPVTTGTMTYDPGQRPEFKQQDCTPVYNPNTQSQTSPCANQ